MIKFTLILECSFIRDFISHCFDRGADTEMLFCCRFYAAEVIVALEYLHCQGIFNNVFK